MTYILTLLIIGITSVALLFPQDAIALIAELKRRLRLRVIHRAGTEGIKDLSHVLHKFAASKGIEPELVEDVLAEHHDLIVERVGKHYADEILGEPDPTERYF